MISEQLRAYQWRIEQYLNKVLPASDVVPNRLHEAMRYSALEGGKRMRPMLVYASGCALGVDEDLLDAPAAAIELLHVYSLVHDDLPAMDDDDLRRGKPTNHKAFDEATAILVGDALQAQAFAVLSATNHLLTAHQQLVMLRELANAANSQGMVGGQAIDLAATGKSLSENELEQMHRYKTGALIRASVLLGAYGAVKFGVQQKQALIHYAECVGLAFQVQDDILDIESNTEILGKTQGADQAANKPTYPSIIGLANAKKKLQHLYDEAMSALVVFDDSADSLREIAKFTVNRLH